MLTFMGNTIKSKNVMRKKIKIETPVKIKDLFLKKNSIPPRIKVDTK